jgi:hypothetical protein
MQALHLPNIFRENPPLFARVFLGVKNMNEKRIACESSQRLAIFEIFMESFNIPT